MAKKSAKGSIRMNISVPIELKKRMDKAREGINWSALACRAFEAKLGEFAMEKVRKGMSTDINDVVARLKAEQHEEGEESSYKEGFASGQQWARAHATQRQMRHLSNYRDQLNRDFDAVIASAQTPEEPAWKLFCELVPNREGDHNAFNEFWKEQAQADSHQIEESDFVLGFAYGVLDIWYDVRAQL